MCTVAVTASLAVIRPGPRPPSSGSVISRLAGFHRLLEAFQAVRPELGEEITQPGQSLRAHDVHAPLALRADRHQARVPEDLQMLGHRLLGDVELPGDLRDRPRP